jgi:hypothetical protein
MVFNAHGSPLITAVIGPLGVFGVDSREVVVVVPRRVALETAGKVSALPSGCELRLSTSFAGILRVKLRKGA